MDLMSRFDDKDASDERARISEMKADAMRMIEEMSPAAFEAWYNINLVVMNEAATASSSISTAALIAAPEGVFNEWMREDEREIDETEEMNDEAWYAVASPAKEARRFQFAAATRGQEEPV